MIVTPPEDGNTLLDEDERDGLIPDHITTRAELNQWEALNIQEAQSWLSRHAREVLNVEFLRELHRRMFGSTWTWAGTFRTSVKNISPYNASQVGPLLHDLVENTRTQHDRSDKTDRALDEIATRFHHSLVRIHPWPNGNGRHARMATDALLVQWRRPRFTWGGETDLGDAGNPRSAYITALKRADAGDFGALRDFVRS